MTRESAVKILLRDLYSGDSFCKCLLAKQAATEVMPGSTGAALYGIDMVENALRSNPEAVNRLAENVLKRDVFSEESLFEEDDMYGMQSEEELDVLRSFSGPSGTAKAEPDETDEDWEDGIEEDV